ncbi:MAG: amylo-alpha-1,6-glucosidase [Candidatus Micrarchaeaceae archaeon]
MPYDINENALVSELDVLRSSEGYLFAGSPKFKGLFGRDSIISSWQLLDYDASIARDTLIALAAVQGTKADQSTGEQPGKIIHEYYKSGVTSTEWFNSTKAQSGWLKMDRPEYLSIDSTPLFIILLSKYYQKTKDSKTLSMIWPHAKMAAEWIMDYGIKDKFVRYVPNDGKLRSQSWKDGAGKFLENLSSPVAIVEVQGYTYLAMRCMMDLMKATCDSELLERASAASSALKADFEERFWMEEYEYYAIAIDGNGRQVRSITSNPGHLLFTGIADAERARAIAKRITMGDMMTPYGIRTHSSKDGYFDPFAYQLGSVWPHDNWIIAQGLKAIGNDIGYEAVRNSVISAATKLRAMPEYYGVSKSNDLIPLNEMRTQPCDPQAWSLAALIDFIRS